MTSAIRELDVLQTRIVETTYQAVPHLHWRSVTMFAKYSPDASIGGLDFDFCMEDGAVDQTCIPAAASRAELYGLTKDHWRLTQELGQPRWYKMTVTIERSGKYSVDFEYKHDYQEGDIMARG